MYSTLSQTERSMYEMVKTQIFAAETGIFLLSRTEDRTA
jgi:hypothetical protein